MDFPEQNADPGVSLFMEGAVVLSDDQSQYSRLSLLNITRIPKTEDFGSALVAMRHLHSQCGYYADTTQGHAGNKRAPSE